MERILAIGPYIGNFEYEILQFRPYAKWLSEVIDWDKIYLSAHINRFFLYDFIPEENKIPVYKQFSRDEENQKKCVHKKINKKDFNLILKTFKEEIIKKENCNKKDIEIYNLPYLKNSPPCDFNKKIFERISNVYIEIQKEYKNKIVFIPAKQEKIEKLSYIYNWLRRNYYDDLIVVGSTDTWFSNDNVVLNKIDYFDSGWKHIISHILEAKVIITPASYWTVVSNLQNRKVFSWGSNPGLYKERGVYNFGNKDCIVIPSDDDTDPNIIIKNIRSFINMYFLRR